MRIPLNGSQNENLPAEVSCLQEGVPDAYAREAAEVSGSRSQLPARSGRYLPFFDGSEGPHLKIGGAPTNTARRFNQPVFFNLDPEPPAAADRAFTVAQPSTTSQVGAHREATAGLLVRND